VGHISPCREFVNPHYRNEQGLPRLGITSAQEATNLANVINDFLAANNNIRHLLAQCEPEVVKSFRIIIDIFKALTDGSESSRRFGGSLSAEEKRLINQHLSEENVEAIDEVLHRFFGYDEDGN